MRYRILYIQKDGGQYPIEGRGAPSGYFCSIKAAQKALGIKRVNSDMILYFKEFTYHICRAVT